MVTKMVVRVLDSTGRMLGWTEAAAESRGDGCLWWVGQPTVLIDEDGAATALSIHWADVNVEVRLPVNVPISVERGQSVNVDTSKTALVVGPMATGLAPVTVRASVTIGIPTGSLSAVTH